MFVLAVRLLQGTAIKAELLEELPQGHFGDAEVPRLLDEVEQFITRGFGMGKDKLGDRAGMPRQEFSVRATAEVVMNLLTNLLRGMLSMTKGRARADPDQACDLADFQSHTTVKQEVAGDPRTGIVPLAPPQKFKRRLQDGLLLIAQLFRIDLRPTQPLFERLTFRGHDNASLVVSPHAAEV